MDKWTKTPPHLVDKALSDGILRKIVLLGDGGVGKTSFLHKFDSNSFTPTYIPTIGIDFHIASVVKEENEFVKLQLWDTSGQQRFKTITSAYYRGAHGFLIFYDTTDGDSFDSVKNWKHEVDNYADSKCPVVIIGMKADNEESKQVPLEDALEVASSLNIDLIECSAKDGKNVTEAVSLITEKMIVSVGKEKMKVQTSDSQKNRSKTCSIL